MATNKGKKINQQAAAAKFISNIKHVTEPEEGRGEETVQQKSKKVTKKPKDIQRCYYVPDDLHAQVKIKAVLEKCSASDIVIEALKEYFENHK